MSDIGITIAVEDAAVRAGMSRVETNILGSINRMTAPMKQFRGLLSFAAGGAGVAVALGAVSSAVELAVEGERMLTRHLNENLNLYNKVTAELRAGNEELRRRAGLESALQADLRENLKIEREKSTAFASTAKAETLKRPDTFTGMASEAFTHMFGLNSIERQQALLDEMFEAGAGTRRKAMEAEYRMLRENRELADRKARDELSLKTDIGLREMKISELRELGLTHQAEIAQTILEHEKNLIRLQEDAAQGNMLRMAEREAAEEGRYRAKLDRIEREHQAQTAMDADRERKEMEQAAEMAERESRRRDDMAFTAELFEKQQEADKAELEGDTRRSRLLEAEIAGRRKIREIERLEGIDESRRARLMAEQGEINAAERRRLDGGERGGVGSAAAGIINRGATTLQLGGVTQMQGRGVSAAERTERNTRKTAESIDAMRRDLRSLAGRPATVA